MSHKLRYRIRAGGLVLAMVLAAPVAFATGDHEGGHDDEHGDHGHAGGHEFGFGAAASDAEADRTVEIVAHDTMKFDPSSVSVKSGETVRFVVRNAGQLQHSFTLGSPEYQEEHEKEMQGMAMENMAGHMADSDNGIVVQPGKTDSLTWRFEQNGPVQFACHIPGHYPAGMKGSLAIQ